MEAALVLNPRDNLNADVAAELDRALGDRSEPVIVLGKTAALADAVVQQLQGLGFSNVTRIGEDNRCGTAASITGRLRTETVAHGKGPLKKMFVANGQTGPIDALVMGAVAALDTGGARGGMLLVCSTTSIPTETTAELANNPSLTELNIFGGTVRIPDALFTALKANVPAGATSRRVADSNRYSTATSAALTFFNNPGRLGLAAGAAPDGTLSIDALVFAPLMAAKGGPILLTNNTALNAATASYLKTVAPYVIELNTVGGVVAVSDAVKAAAEKALGH
jgi:hypothetical protein